MVSKMVLNLENFSRYCIKVNNSSTVTTLICSCWCLTVSSWHSCNALIQLLVSHNWFQYFNSTGSSMVLSFSYIKNLYTTLRGTYWGLSYVKYHQARDAVALNPQSEAHTHTMDFIITLMKKMYLSWIGHVWLQTNANAKLTLNKVCTTRSVSLHSFSWPLTVPLIICASVSSRFAGKMETTVILKDVQHENTFRFRANILTLG